MKLAEAVGIRTKELLFEKKVTQYRLTKITCLNEKTISDILHGRTSDIKFSTIYLIASAFKITLQEFLDSPLFSMDNLEI
ncbi:MAG: helix-turn-helix domain-containing protein [Christensenellales bacterium]